MNYDESAFAALVGKVLEELEDGTWELNEAEHGRFYLHCPALEGSGLDLSLSKGRVVVHGFASAAPRAWRVEMPQITVAATRGPEVIAREIERRLLPRYREALQAAMAEQREFDAHERAVQVQAQQLAAIIGEDMDTYHSTTDPLICRYQRLPKGTLATLQLRAGRSRHRLELSLPHDQAVAVVELLAGLWEAG